MPNYTFYNKKLKEEFIEHMSMSELDNFLLINPHLEQVVTAPAIADPTRLGLRKPDSGFRDVLKRVKKASGRRNTINTW
jgi:hypothetical protein